VSDIGRSARPLEAAGIRPVENPTGARLART
jgi:hypothetical protein